MPVRRYTTSRARCFGRSGSARLPVLIPGSAHMFMSFTNASFALELVRGSDVGN